jgi:hypothetical protein
MGTGYGIILTKSQIDELGDGTRIEEKIGAYFDDHIRKACDIMIKKISPVPRDDVNKMANLLHYQQYMHVDDSKRTGQPVFKHGNAIRCAMEEFVYPSEEHGTRSFLGFVNDVHYNSDTCCAMLLPLVLLGVKCGIGEGFEFHVPVNDEKTPLSMDQSMFATEKAKKDPNTPKYIPNPHYLASGMGKDYASRVEESTGKGEPVPFQTKEACDEFASAWIKEWGGITSVWYRRGLELVRVIFPERAMKDIERYIVGWWS